MGHKNNGVDKFAYHWKSGEVDRIRQLSLLWRSPMVPSLIEYH